MQTLSIHAQGKNNHLKILLNRLGNLRMSLKKDLNLSEMEKQKAIKEFKELLEEKKNIHKNLF